MKRIELLEALFLQGKRMRETQIKWNSFITDMELAFSDLAYEAFQEQKKEQDEYDRISGEIDRLYEDDLSTTLEVTEVLA